MADNRVDSNLNSEAVTKTKNDFVYAERAQTNIYLEQPSATNPYVSKCNFLHGYNVLELMHKKSFVEVLLLLFTGEFPSSGKVQLLERLMIGLIDLGPRHPAVKAAMVAGVSKTNAEHLLSIGLSVLGGAVNGAKEVEQSIFFLQQNIGKPVADVLTALLASEQVITAQGEQHLCPGFGNHYGSIDEFTAELAQTITNNLDSTMSYPFITWAQHFCSQLASHNMGWLKTGLAAAVFCELGIAPREAIGLFQLVCAPGIFAHGVEQSHQPITSIPMLSDDQHICTYKMTE